MNPADAAALELGRLLMRAISAEQEQARLRYELQRAHARVAELEEGTKDAAASGDTVAS